MSFCVYKATSPDKNSYVYYGYCSTENPASEAFNKQSTRPETERRDVQFVQKCGGIEHITVVDVEHTETEFEAFVLRNEYRRRDPHSYTGPSVFPPLVYARAQKLYPDQAQEWNKSSAAYNAKTALEAYQAGVAFSFQSIKQLAARFTKEVIMSDLASLTYREFRLKYDIE